MSDLSNTVLAYYSRHFDDLPADKQFHFASRLYLFCQEPSARGHLDALQPWVTSDGQPHKALETLAHNPPDAKKGRPINAAELRGPALAKYPELYARNAVLFRTLFMRTLYGIDARDQFFSLFDRASVLDLKNRLLADDEALGLLSTYAVNFLYLLERTILEDEAGLPLGKFLDIGHTRYDVTDAQQLQLFIYLYTHCIIAETHFYHRPIPTQHHAIYQQMITELESLMSTHFTNIHLDNKFEFLVCCKIIGHTTALQGRIFAEAEQSVSEQGDFLVDRHNRNGQRTKSTLDTSEHRNVLFILANQPFTPLATA